MKNRFFKHWAFLIQYLIFFSVSTINAMFLVIFLKHNLLFLINTSFFFSLFLLILFIFIRTKILIENQGIKVIKSKKTIKTIFWEEIIDVSLNYKNMKPNLIFVLTSHEEIEFNISEKILSTILILCNNEKIKEKIKLYKIVY